METCQSHQVFFGTCSSFPGCLRDLLRLRLTRSNEVFFFFKVKAGNDDTQPSLNDVQKDEEFDLIRLPTLSDDRIAVSQPNGHDTPSNRLPFNIIDSNKDLVTGCRLGPRVVLHLPLTRHPKVVGVSKWKKSIFKCLSGALILEITSDVVCLFDVVDPLGRNTRVGERTDLYNVDKWVSLISFLGGSGQAGLTSLVQVGNGEKRKSYPVFRLSVYPTIRLSVV